jgi:hypothetical protein
LTLHRLCHYCFSLLFLGAASSALHATVTLQVITAIPSPQPVGTPINIEATGTSTGAGPVNYQFEIGLSATGPFAVKEDFSLSSTFPWGPTSGEGSYFIHVIARDNTTKETDTVVLPFTITSRVTGNKPVVNPTQHPLVALFSAPKCPAGSQMHVKFVAPFDPNPFYTNWVNCTTTSMNFLIGGMRAATSTASFTYSLNYEVQTGTTITPDTNILSFTPGKVPASITLPTSNFNVASSPATSQAERIVVIGGTGGPRPFANDLQGYVVWYYGNTGLYQLTRMVEGGEIMVIANGPGTGSGPYGNNSRQQVVRVEDIAGNIIHETSCDRLSEELLAQGVIPNGLDRFNHEARKLPNGDYLILGETQQIFPAGTQSYTTSIDLIGPAILILNENFQVVYSWNAFNHANSTGSAGYLPLNRRNLYGGNCDPNAQGQTPVGCPPSVLLSPAFDWLHTNCLQLLSDGDILFSMRNQNWIAKIDYNNGTGTNSIVWIMGKGGDFTFVNPTNTYPWFSGQHDTNFQFGGMTTLSVYDDGNERYTQQIGDGNSRGMVLSVDEASLTVSSLVNADLGVASYGLGSAQPLQNNDWFFSASYIEPTKTTTQAIEISTGSTQTLNEGVDAVVYRSFRLTDFYNIIASID